jgi:hypothetical protein
LVRTRELSAGLAVAAAVVVVVVVVERALLLAVTWFMPE